MSTITKETSNILSPHEQKVKSGWEEAVFAEKPRVSRMLKSFRDKPPKVDIQRARLLTESFKETESLPLVLRWAKALENILTKIDVYIGPDELIVGCCGGPGRIGLLHPELRGGWLAEGLRNLSKQRGRAFSFTPEDVKVITEEIVPYWKGKTLYDRYMSLMPEQTRRIIYGDKNHGRAGIILDEGTTATSNWQWILDYKKVLQRGFRGIKQDAVEKLECLDILDPKNRLDKLPFLKAVIIVCDAMGTFARRYAELAKNMAQKETDDQRKRDLEQIAEICQWVPENPARTFREAIQAQWFTQLAYRFEQFSGGVAGNGRIDQYLYPYYERDKKEGRITDDEVLELLECLWLNMAKYVPVGHSSTMEYMEGYAHFEQTTIGGQTEDGDDATNELSYLMLQSKKEFPLNYPDLTVRIHSHTPEPFLVEVCKLIKEGTGFPKLLNDEAIIPQLLSDGATLKEARDYASSGCIEPRMPNRDTYLSGSGQVNMPAILEMALHDGTFRIDGKREQIGPKTGDPRGFVTFDEMMNAYRLQLESVLWHYVTRQYVSEMVRPETLAGPLQSCLHDLAMEQCLDLHSGRVKGGVEIGDVNMHGFATVVDSLAAIRKLVYDSKVITMSELLEALDANFEGYEVVRQMCLNAPKYGNNDPYPDLIARQVETMSQSFVDKFVTRNGGRLILGYMPITYHVSLGVYVGATPNGRKAGEFFSDGISPSQGCDKNGPTSTLLSVAKSAGPKHTERLLNMKFTPQVLAGEEGTRALASLIRTWCNLKIWHIQFNILNAETLREAQRHPEKYRNLLVRVSGYSAYFVDLTPGVQNEIISRTEQLSLS